MTKISKEGFLSTIQIAFRAGGAEGKTDANELEALFLRFIDTFRHVDDGTPFFLQRVDPVPDDSADGTYHINTASWDVFEKQAGAWVKTDNLKGAAGEPGAPGPPGATGKSAFEIWQSLGNAGTEADFLASLEGQAGKDGDSAYAIWLAAGNSGTQAEFLASLKGEQGPEGKPGLGMNNRRTWISGDTYYENDYLFHASSTDPAVDSMFIWAGPEAGGVSSTAPASDPTNWKEFAGLPGPEGKQGVPGKSAYQIALDNGFSGTQAQWLASLKGAAGDSAYQVWLSLGNTGTKQDFINALKGSDGAAGQDGQDGIDGDSAYEVWLAQGNAGTEADFLASLRGNDGTDGKSAYELWRDAGNEGSVTDFLASLEGAEGLSAYQVWQAQGNVGSAADFLASLAGADGKSAYQQWLDAGNTGTAADFLNSLKGTNGLSAYEVWVAQGNAGTQADFLASLEGAEGKSAYQLWLDAGNTGSMADYLASLEGEQGEPGTPGLGMNNRVSWVAGETYYQNDYLFEESSTDPAIDSMYVWQGPDAGAVSNTAPKSDPVNWKEFKGLPGPEGKKGADGRSAYEVAVANGFTGTQLQWLNSLKGAEGKSAYQIWLAAGNVGSEGVFLNSLKGDNGKSAYQLWLDAGNSGTEAAFLASLEGTNGLSAYQVWLAMGNSGTEAQYLASLKGADGKSAYQLWREAGNIGTTADFLASLEGADGKSAYQVWLDAGNTGSMADYLASLEGEQGAPGTPGLGMNNRVSWVAGETYYQNDYLFEESSTDPAVDSMYVWQGPDAGAVSNTAPKSDPVNWKEFKGLPGPEGKKGADGRSAYEVAVANGFTGTQAQWLASLKGAAGDSAYQLWIAAGNAGTEADFLASLHGQDGRSAYQLWLDAGNTGTMTDYFASLKGAEGKQGPKGDNYGILDINKTAHGWTVGTAINNLDQRAQANHPDNADFLGFVIQVVDANNVKVAQVGLVDTIGWTDDQGAALVARKPYFLSATVPGAISLTPPPDTAYGQVNKPILLSRPNNKAVVQNLRGMEIVEPADGSGGGSGSGVEGYNDIATLKSIDTTDPALWPDKKVVYIEATKTFYALDRESTAAGDDDGVIAPTTGIGRWVRKVIPNASTTQDGLMSKEMVVDVAMKNASNEFTELQELNSAAFGNTVVEQYVDGDVYPRYKRTVEGQQEFGKGDTPYDVRAYRARTGVYAINPNFLVTGKLYAYNIYNFDDENAGRVSVTVSGVAAVTSLSGNVAFRVVNNVINPTADLFQALMGSSNVMAKITSAGVMDAKGFAVDGVKAFVNQDYIDPSFIATVDAIPDTEKAKLDDVANWSNKVYVGPALVGCLQGQEYYTADGNYYIRMKTDIEPKRMSLV